MRLIAPGLGARVFDGTVVIEGCMVERRVGIEVECGRTVCLKMVVVIGMPLDIVGGSWLLGMAWFDMGG